MILSTPSNVSSDGRFWPLADHCVLGPGETPFWWSSCGASCSASVFAIDSVSVSCCPPSVNLFSLPSVFAGSTGRPGTPASLDDLAAFASVFNDDLEFDCNWDSLSDRQPGTSSRFVECVSVCHSMDLDVVSTVIREKVISSDIHLCSVSLTGVPAGESRLSVVDLPLRSLVKPSEEFKLVPANGFELCASAPSARLTDAALSAHVAVQAVSTAHVLSVGPHSQPGSVDRLSTLARCRSFSIASVTPVSLRAVFQIPPGPLEYPLARDLFVAGRTNQCVDVWAQLGDAVVLGWVRDGVWFDVDPTIPPQRHFPRSSGAKTRLALNVLLEKKVAGSVPTICLGRGFVNRIFTVAKKNSPIPRSILDNAYLNGFVLDFGDSPSFRLDTFAIVRLRVEPHMWFVKYDLKDAYFSVLIHPLCRQWLRFIVDDEWYEYRVLPMGLKISPLVFQKTLRVIIRVMRQCGYWLNQYLDDVLHANLDQALLCEQSLVFAHATDNAGLDLSWSKFERKPSQQIEFLGIEIDSVSMCCLCTVPKAQDIIAVAEGMQHDLMAGRPVSLLRMAVLLGKIEFISQCCQVAKLYSLGLNLVRSESLRLVVGPATRRVYRTRSVKLDVWALKELKWWSEQTSESLRGFTVPLRPPAPTLVINTDASESGWGGVKFEYKGQVPVPDSVSPLRTVAGWWYRGPQVEGVASPIREPLTSNQRELAAVGLVIGALNVRNCSVVVLTDNSTVVGCLSSQSTTERDLAAMLYDVLVLLNELHVTVLVRHIPGVDNVLADVASRLTPPRSMWQFNPRYFVWFLRKYVLLSKGIDLFATLANRLLPKFFSFEYDLGCTGVDAFVQCWSYDLIGFCWCNPPFQFLLRVFDKMREDGAWSLVVCPIWVGSPWLVVVLQYAARVFLLPPVRDLFLSAQQNYGRALGPPQSPHCIVEFDARRPARALSLPLPVVPKGITGMTTLLNLLSVPWEMVDFRKL